MASGRPPDRRSTKAGEQHGDAETIRRRDEAVRRALNTPPKPLKEMAAERKGKGGKRK